WNSPYFFWQLPAELHSELSQAGLVIIKGDANYRRLLGDSQWPTTVSAADAIPYFPTPFVCLRTLKSDPIVGLSVGLAESLDQKDSNWRINGKRGVIQAVINPS
ncbi:MAG: ARMT1-like domain-containing protein, partial [Chloroflexota bacterium]